MELSAEYLLRWFQCSRGRSRLGTQMWKAKAPPCNPRPALGGVLPRESQSKERRGEGKKGEENRAREGMRKESATTGGIQGGSERNRKWYSRSQEVVSIGEDLGPERGLWGRVISTEMSPPRLFWINHLLMFHCSPEARRS